MWKRPLQEVVFDTRANPFEVHEHSGTWYRDSLTEATQTVLSAPRHSSVKIKHALSTIDARTWGTSRRTSCTGIGRF